MRNQPATVAVDAIATPLAHIIAQVDLLAMLAVHKGVDALQGPTLETALVGLSERLQDLDALLTVKASDGNA